VLGLILSNPPEGYSGYPIATPAATASNQVRPQTTLIITSEVSVAIWESYVRRHVNVDAERVTLVVDRYMGSEKSAVLKRVVDGELDVVFTTYETLLSDFRALYPKGTKPKLTEKKRKAAQVSGSMNMFIYGFYRVVLDAGE
jgi:SNF2-related domain